MGGPWRSFLLRASSRGFPCPQPLLGGPADPPASPTHPQMRVVPGALSPSFSQCDAPTPLAPQAHTGRRHLLNLHVQSHLLSYLQEQNKPLKTTSSPYLPPAPNSCCFSGTVSPTQKAGCPPWLLPPCQDLWTPPPTQLSGPSSQPPPHAATTRPDPYHPGASCFSHPHSSLGHLNTKQINFQNLKGSPGPQVASPHPTSSFPSVPVRKPGQLSPMQASPEHPPLHLSLLPGPSTMQPAHSATSA